MGNEMNIESGETKSCQTAIGFCVKSRWATAVLLAGPLQSPRPNLCGAALVVGSLVEST